MELDASLLAAEMTHLETTSQENSDLASLTDEADDASLYAPPSGLQIPQASSVAGVTPLELRELPDAHTILPHEGASNESSIPSQVSHTIPTVAGPSNYYGGRVVSTATEPPIEDYISEFRRLLRANYDTGMYDAIEAKSWRAHVFITSNKLAANEAQLKLFLAYTMFYLTLEYGIVPYLKEQNPTQGIKAIHGAKWAWFHSLLNEINQVEIKASTLYDYVRYGKVLWTMVSSMGIVVLPMLAIATPSVTLLAGTHGLQSKHIPIVGIRLASNLTWMSICQAWSPIAVETIFGHTSGVYTTRELFHFLIAQPLRTAVLRELHTEYLQISEKVPSIRHLGRQITPPTLTIQSAHGLLGELDVDINIFANDHYPNGGKSGQVGGPYVTSGSDAFTSLLLPGHVNDELVGFLSALWNGRALPGWALMSPQCTTKLLDGRFGHNLVPAIGATLEGTRFGVHYENIILPMITNRAIIPLAISLLDRTLTLFPTDDTSTTMELAEKLLEANKKLICNQLINKNVLFNNWSSMISSVGRTNDTSILTRDESYLRYLHYAHSVVTGSRFFNEAINDVGIPDSGDIIAACLLEAYELVHGDEEVLDPDSCCFQTVVNAIVDLLKAITAIEKLSNRYLLKTQVQSSR
ncbi:hypothetical protein HOY82DRAFT_542192 [Tuber indicum]|nr:hypothetical protein HOY82DRAFT_542192 [Tuber indicum]